MPWTSLPNLHPAVVHLPIAFIPLAAGFDLASFAAGRRDWLDRTAAILYPLGALAAGAAYLAGEEAEEGLHGVPSDIAALIEGHSDWAMRALVVVSLAAIVRVLVWWRERAPASRRARGGRLVALAAGLSAIWLLIEAADRGGALVYLHGVAVARPAAGEAGPPSASSPRP